MEYTGERYVPDLDTPEISYEHWHRYLYASQFVAGKVVLDIASGEGYGSNLLADIAKNVIGVDSDSKAVRWASSKYRRTNLEFRCGAADAIPVEERHFFDIVVSFETVEHLGEEHQRRFWHEIKRLLKPEGTLILSTPNKLFYSDKRNYKNEHHRKEFYEKEILICLHQFFRTVHILGQRTYPTSYIWPLSESSQPLSEHQLTYSNEEFEPVSGDRKELLYILAICSDAEKQVPCNSVLLDTSERATRIRLEQLAEKGKAVENLQEQLIERTALAKRTAEEVAQRDTRIRDLQAAVAEKEATGRQVAELRQDVERQAEHLDALAARIDLVLSRQEDLRATVIGIHDHLVRRDEELQTAIYELQGARALLHLSAAEASKEISSQHLIRRIRDTVRTTLPRNATVLVVSKGDEQLLKLYGRQASHFPQTKDGVYAGHHPRNSLAAIAHLEAMRSKGSDFLLFPATALWWLEHYVEFRQHLERRYRVVAKQEDTCVIFALREQTVSGITAWWMEFEEIIAQCQSRLDRDPAVLDWNTGLDLATKFPQHTIFSPHAADGALPYLDSTIDVVVALSQDPASIAEAHRVAKAVVVKVIGPQDSKEEGRTLAVDWKLEGAGAELPTTSIIIPCYNAIAYTEACLTSLWETLPPSFRGEIIVIDDASTDETPARLKHWLRLESRLKTMRNRKNSGFLTSVNRGARAATGDILIFLNNDTVLLPGWLSPLFRVFRDHPDAGAVGAKLMYPDGRLWEAGGIVFSDGSVANFGQWDYQVDAPLYNYVRKVDYCSGALLATRSSLFVELGGFEAHYGSVRYADIEYCFKVRQKGYQVYYQPESTGIFFNRNSTSNTDSSYGNQQHQVLNRDKFLAKWGHALKRQPPPPGQFDSATWDALAVIADPDWAENR